VNECDVFTAALELESPDERRTFLDDACQGDAALRERVETLLRSHSESGDLLENPLTAVVAIKAQTDCLGITETVGNRAMPEIHDVLLGFLDPSEVPGSLGRIGQYEVLELVGRGGMGIVLKAQDTRLNRIVALKVLAPVLAANATARKRFLREAQAAAAVSHDHVVTIYAVEEGDRGEKASDAKTATLPYLVMEFIDGQSLQQKIDREGALELKEILRIGKQTADGLAAAHAQGLIHRDVKPANILLQNGIERVQITDFGLARAVDDVDITRIGEVAGTPEYMSPEQAQAQPVDVRSDLFSLGSVLYAMCTGRSAFRADTTMGVLRRVCDDTPRPICEIHAEAPDWLVAIVDRLLEKTADDRFQTAAEVADLLGKHLAHVQDPRSTPFPGVVSPVKRRVLRATNRHPWWVAAGVALVLIAATLGMTEATGVTRLSSTVVRIVTGEGTLVIEVDDPEVQVSLDGEELSITGAGLKEIKLRPGQYQFQATKDGEPLKTELVSITRGDRLIVRVTRESASPAPPIVGEVERGAFVVLNASGEEVRKFDTLADAVLGSSAGDTIEIRGNGPFVTDMIQISHPLVIRAGQGFWPVIRMSRAGEEEYVALMDTSAALVVEGIELQWLFDPPRNGDRQSHPHLIRGWNTTLSVANCRFRMSPGMLKVAIYAFGPESVISVRNSLFLTPDACYATCSGDIKLRTIKNCLQAGWRTAGLHFSENRSVPENVVLENNTLLLTSAPVGLRTAQGTDRTLVSVRSAGNVVDAPASFVFQDESDPPRDTSRIRELLEWTDHENLFRINAGYLKVWTFPHELEPLPTLAGWKEFWDQPEASISQGTIRYQGGELLGKLREFPELITAEDFRLRPDSAGYQAGPDGKDLGANVDLVGPGEAYERWKETPEYQEWLTETAKLLSGEGSVRQEGRTEGD